MVRQIYAASSWRNAIQPEVVRTLRSAGHEVYDFRNPTEHYDNPDGLARGFHWSEIDPDWQEWSADSYRSALAHPLSGQGFASDWGAMQWADTGVLILPCGRSAHLEAGYFTGAGKDLFILLNGPTEPELMYLMAKGVYVDTAELIEALKVTK